MEIAIVSGPEPVTYLAGPQSALPEVDKYDIFGDLTRAPIELVKGKNDKGRLCH